MNRVVKTALATYSHQDQRNWDEHLRLIAFGINTALSEVTGFTPARLVFGRELRPLFSLDTSISLSTEFDPADYDNDLQRDLALIYDKALKNVQKAKEQQSRQYNLRHREPKFNEGDMVWRRNFSLSQGANYIAAKLLPKFVGPFIIKKKISNTQFQLNNLRGVDVGVWPSIHFKHVVN